MEELNAHVFDTELNDTIAVTAAGDDGSVHLLVIDAKTGENVSTELNAEEVYRLIGALEAGSIFSVNN